MRDGVMKVEMTEADFEKGELTFRAIGEYYARGGYFYIVPNTMWEEIQSRLSGDRGTDER